MYGRTSATHEPVTLERRKLRLSKTRSQRGNGASFRVAKQHVTGIVGILNEATESLAVGIIASHILSPGRGTGGESHQQAQRGPTQPWLGALELQHPILLSHAVKRTAAPDVRCLRNLRGGEGGRAFSCVGTRTEEDGFGSQFLNECNYCDIGNIGSARTFVQPGCVEFKAILAPRNIFCARDYRASGK